MKYFLLSTLLITAIAASSQVTYTTTATGGDYTLATTWQGGAAAAPPTATPALCNCRIVVVSGATLRINGTRSLQNAAIILDGPNSVLTFTNNSDLTLTGTSSIDIQNETARIVRGNPNNNIILGGATIYDGGTTALPAGNPAGQVNGLRSASSARANPQFQSGTLPVKLAEFTASEKGSGVTLAWKTDLEVNSSHFEVERSGDSKEWDVVGSVQAGGNVSVEQSYSFTDAAPLDGNNYYRLKIIDLDGQFEYSPIKTISITTTALNVVVGPNPANSFLNIAVNQPGREPYRLRLINRSGQVVFDQKYQAANNRLNLSVANYADGTYFLEISNSNGLKKISKVMIVRK